MDMTHSLCDVKLVCMLGGATGRTLTVSFVYVYADIVFVYVYAHMCQVTRSSESIHIQSCRVMSYMNESWHTCSRYAHRAIITTILSIGLLGKQTSLYFLLLYISIRIQSDHNRDSPLQPTYFSLFLITI